MTQLQLLSSINPYYDSNFFDFFAIFFSRLFTGEIQLQNLVSDELQLIILSLIAISTSLVGTFLYLRKITMLANALSHTILAGVVLAYIVHQFFGFAGENFDFSELMPQEWLLIVSGLCLAFLTTFLTELLSSKVHLSADASCACVFTFLFAVGVILVTVFSRNAHIGTELLMGNADALHADDLALQWKVTLFTLAVVVLLYRPLLVTTFDPLFSHLLGVNSTLFGYLLMSLVAITSVGAFRAVGVLLVLAFFVAPPLIARLWVKRLVPLLVLSTAIGIAATFIGVSLARHLLSVFALPVSTSALIVSVLAAIYFLAILVSYCQIVKKITRSPG